MVDAWLQAQRLRELQQHGPEILLGQAQADGELRSLETRRIEKQRLLSAVKEQLRTRMQSTMQASGASRLGTGASGASGAQSSSTVQEMDAIEIGLDQELAAIAAQSEATQIASRTQAQALRFNIAEAQLLAPAIDAKRKALRALSEELQRATRARNATKQEARERRDAVLEAHRRRFDADLEDKTTSP